MTEPAFPFRLRLLQPLRHGPYALLWVGQTISRLGDSTYATVLTWTTYAITHSSTATGLVLTAFSIPLLLMLLAGGIVGDRLSRRGLILVSDTISGVTIGIVAVLALAGHLSIAALVAMSIVFGTVSAFFGPAYQALIPDVVPEQGLQAANALQAVSISASGIVGPALGATLYAWGRAGAAFAFDALSFLAAAVASLLLRVPSHPTPTRGSIWQDVRAGWSYVRKTSWLLGGITIAAVANAAGNAPFFVLLPAVIRHLHLGVGTMGLTLGITAVFSVVTNLLVGQIPSFPRRGMIMFVIWSFIGLSTALVGLASSYTLVAIAAALKGVTFAGDTIWNGLVQERVPREYRSRVTSLDMLGSFALLPLGYAISGVSASVIGTRPTLVAGGAVAFVLALTGLLIPSARRIT